MPYWQIMSLSHILVVRKIRLINLVEVERLGKKAANPKYSPSMSSIP